MTSHILKCFPLTGFLITLFLLASTACGNRPSNKQAGFVWDFEQPRKLVYSFSQHTESQQVFSKEEVAQLYILKSRGTLYVSVGETHTADVNIGNLIAETTIIDSVRGTRDTLKNQSNPLSFPGMKADGSFSDMNSASMFKMLFPLPALGMKEGETDQLPMEAPLNANGSLMYAKGFNTVTFTGYTDLDGHHCAVLEGKIDITELTPPEGLNGTFSLANLGEGTYYFDLENQYYVGCDVRMGTESLIDMGSGAGEASSLYLKSKTENTFSLRLLRIDES